MIPKDKVELIVARFTFVSHINPNQPLITLTRKRHSPGGSMTVVRGWFESVVNAEKENLPQGTVLRFAEYRILSGEPELFKVDGFVFEKILLVLGEEYAYWIFYQNMPLQRRVEGKAILPISYCPCCFQNQYARVMRTIKDTFRPPSPT